MFSNLELGYLVVRTDGVPTFQLTEKGGVGLKCHGNSGPLINDIHWRPSNIL